MAGTTCQFELTSSLDDEYPSSVTGMMDELSSEYHSERANATDDTIGLLRRPN